MQRNHRMGSNFSRTSFGNLMLLFSICCILHAIMESLCSLIYYDWRDLSEIPLLIAEYCLEWKLGFGGAN